MSSADSPGRRVWSNEEEFLLDKALTRYLNAHTGYFAARPNGHILKEEDLWTCGQRGAKLAVMQKLVGWENEHHTYRKSGMGNITKAVVTLFCIALHSIGILM